MNKFPIENINKVNASKNADLSSKATQLATSRDIILSGDASGSASFNGTDNASITVAVADDSHNHTIANIDNLQSILDELENSSMKVKSTEPIKTPDADTVQAWIDLGPGVYWYITDGYLKDQPSKYGILINYVANYNVFQIWHSQNAGPMYTRSGSISSMTETNPQGWIDTNTWIEYRKIAATATPKAPGTAAVGTSDKYAREDHVHPLPDIGAFPSGTKMLFHQSAAPTGWTKQTSINDSALRVVSGDTGGGTGGSVAFSTLFATGKTVSLSGNVGATTLSVSQMPSHSHSITLYNTGSTSNGYHIQLSGLGTSVMAYPSTNYTGSSYSHTHSLSGTASIALNVKYTDVIICQKD